MGYSIKESVYVNRHLHAIALDRVKEAFGKKYYDDKNPDIDEVLSIFVVLFDEKYGRSK
tara:strand:- start:373 stop:549 length:177 start_codon:yes stop_codon:yes gene_type:complete